MNAGESGSRRDYSSVLPCQSWEVHRFSGSSYDYADLLENLHDGIYFVDTYHRITFWNKGAERITGYSAEEVLGSRCSDNILVHVDHLGNNLCTEGCPLVKTTKDGQHRELEGYLSHRNGHRVLVRISTVPIRDEKGGVVGGAEMFSEITPSSILEMRLEELEKLALIDGLTHLANRRYIELELEARFEEKKRFGLRFGFIFLDIDDFKDINDKFGHSLGDQVLRIVSATLKSVARPFDLTGRWGGDEFACIARDISPDALIAIGERFRILIGSSRIGIENGFINATVSIGATLAREDDTAETIFQRADDLMYRCKKSGGNSLRSDVSDIWSRRS